MKKRIIKDIRLFISGSNNETGTDFTTSFGDKKLNAIVKRIVMKLRENEFSLGDFDHLYINFTTFDMAERMSLSDEADRYFPWYRECTMPVETDLYNNLHLPEAYKDIIHRVSTALVTYFSSEDFDKSRILSCVQQAVEQGEEMLMKFKEKTTTKRKAVIYLRFLDTCRFYPLLQINDMENHLLFEKDLPETVTLDYLGEIQVSTKRVTIKPRKNAYTTQKDALLFEY